MKTKPSEVVGNANNNKTVSQVMGEITWLLTQSQIHKNMFISDLEWFVMPAILLEQFRIWNGPNGTPAAFATFAYVSKETDERLENGAHKLAPQEWQGGSIPWVMEIICPFGGTDEIMIDLIKNVFPNQVFKFHSVNEAGHRVVMNSSQFAEKIAQAEGSKPN